jgi:hypothetical protein
MQTHHSTDGTTLTVYVTVIVDGVHTDPDGWLADPDSASVVITAQPSATHTGTRISAGNYKFEFTGLTTIASGTLMSVEINGEIGTVAWTEMVEWVEVIRPLLTSTAQGNLEKSASTICTGTVAAAASTTSIPTSAFSPSGAVLDQFKGRIIIFDRATTTAALRGQATSITGSSNSATPTFTVTALTTAPASGDTFIVV